MLRMQIVNNAITMNAGDRLIADGLADDVDMKREVDSKVDYYTGELKADNGPWRLTIRVSPRGATHLRNEDMQIVTALECAMEVNMLVEATVVVRHARVDASFVVVQRHENSNDQSNVFMRREVLFAVLG